MSDNETTVITNDDLDRLETYLLTGRSMDEDDMNAVLYFEKLSNWQPQLFSWLKDKVERAEISDEVINAHLICLIAIYEKYKSQPSNLEGTINEHIQQNER